MSVLLRRSALATGLVAAVLVVLAPGGSATGARPAPGEDAPASADRMDDFVRSQMAAVGVPGVAYAIVGPRGILHSATFGTDGNGATVDATTPFLWGSLAKPVTATLAMTLVESGDLRLEAPVTRYLPSFRLADQDASDRITLRQLLNQTSGFPTSMQLTDQFAPGRRPADAIPALAEVQPIAAPGAEHHYSSLNYLVLSAVIEEVTGRGFTDVLADRVLDPLGMQDAITSADQAEDRLPPGHRFVFGQAVGFSTPYDPAGVGYGYLGGTLADAAAFAQANLGSDPVVLSDEQREQMYRGDVETGDDMSYGLGWRRWPVREVGADSSADMVWHGGAAPGYQAMTVLLPEQDRAIVVLQNAYGQFQEPRLLETAFGLAALMYGDDPETSPAGIAYPATLGGLGLLCALLLVLVGRSVWVLVRPRTRAPRTRRRVGVALAAWLVGTTAVLYVFAVYLPASLGVGLGQIGLWAPDVGWLVDTLLVLAAALLVLRVAVGARAMWPSRGSSAAVGSEPSPASSQPVG